MFLTNLLCVIPPISGCFVVSRCERVCRSNLVSQNPAMGYMSNVHIVQKSWDMNVQL